MPTLIEDTIAAISTPMGKSGIGVVRLSGKDSLSLLDKVFHRMGGALSDRSPTLGEIVDPDSGQRLDQVLVTCFLAPRSFTREDVVEVSGHGSPVVLKAILQLFMRLGARLATPGEFTLRAFLRGRIDLVQAEAIRDLVEARTLFQARVARQQAGGALSHRLRPLKEQLIQLIAVLEAGIDFAEDDVSVPTDAEVKESLIPLIRELRRLCASFTFGKILAEGFSLAIVGRPNVGKSSLFNALLEEERAIVTEIPGTTRDLVAETAQIRGIPVRLMDTAGIRRVDNKIERLGIDRSLEALADADQIILVLDGSEELKEEDLDLLEQLEGRDFHLVVNKTDLPQRLDPARLKTSARIVTSISALTGEGLDSLRDRIFRAFDHDQALEDEGALLTHVRHEQKAREALDTLLRVQTAASQSLPHELLLLDLYVALRAVNSLTGETTVEDILDRIFSQFCVGK
jgi:tRNA modification GTPase